jgi:hypothetical protein
VVNDRAYGGVVDPADQPIAADAARPKRREILPERGIQPTFRHYWVHCGDMTDFLSLPMNRRTAFKVGAGLGVAGAAGALGYQVIPPAPSARLEHVDALARQLYATLDAEQRADSCVPYDHPLRQYHNRGVWGGGREVLFGFSRRQRGILTDLVHAGLSAEGRNRLPDQDLTRWSGVNSMRALICGNPAAPPYQIVMTGVHLNLRLGGASREGAAFGGPQVYGDQRGNERPGLPNNIYREQFVLARRLFQGMDAATRTRAMLERAPVQTGIELQGRGGVFPGVAIADLDAGHKALAHTLVERIVATYAAGDAAYALACIAANGGIDAMSLSYYARGEDGVIPQAQVFRLEGPGAVLYFRGYPHVHAFINIAMDPGSPLSSGEHLADNPAWLDAAAVKALFEAAMRTETGADVAYYPQDSVAGRLRPGSIRSGDIYTLESWQEPVDVGEVHGSLLQKTPLAGLAQADIDSTRMYKVATTRYGVGRLRDELGPVESPRPRGMLRDLTIAYVKRHGFAQRGA